MGRTLAEKVWDDHVVRRAEGEPDLLFIDLHLLHEVTSPQAFDGLRQNGRAGAAPRPHHRHRGPQHPDPRHRQADRRPGLPRTAGDPPEELCRLRRPPASPGRRRAGRRPRRGTAAGPDPAGHHRRLRRLAHLHARRLRRAGVRHRHQPGRARARHPDAAAGPPQDHGDHDRRRAARGRHRQGPDPGDHHQDRYRRRPGLHPGVPGLRHRETLDGSPDDHLQHVDRGRPPARA